MPLEPKEVELKGRILTKAAVGNEPSSTLITLLDELKRGVSASEELLRSTKIGVTVNKLKQHKDPAVARAAGELVSKWRGDVKRSAGPSGASTPKGAGGSLGAGAGGAGANGVKTGSPAPKSATPVAEVKRHTVPKEKRNAKVDGVDTNVTGNQTRDSCVKLMYDGLAFMSDDLPDEVLRVARAVELAAYSALQPETSEAYKTKIRSLFQNLKNKSNGALRSRVLAGSISATVFVKMTPEELKSAERKASDARLIKENMDKAMVAQEEKSISAEIQCGKCGQRKVSYTQAQTRSADEPMTTFCECLNCGKRWKFS